MLCTLFGVLCHFSHFCYQTFTNINFRPRLTKFGQNSAIKFFRPTFLFLAPFELFGRKFGHLAALRPNREKEPLPTTLAIYLITLGTYLYGFASVQSVPARFFPLRLVPVRYVPVQYLRFVPVVR